MLSSALHGFRPHCPGPIPVRRVSLLACLLFTASAADAQRIATPVLSVAGGIYASPQSVAITEASPGAAVYYTTDGTTPTAASSVYAGPIPVHRTATIRAVAVAPDGGRSAVASGIYDLHGVVPVLADIAGNGAAGYFGDDGPALAARLQHPLAVTVDRSGNVYIADSWNSVVRKVSPTGIITTIAGNGAAGYSGDDGTATRAKLNNPTGIAVDGSGNVLIADAGNNRVRKVSPAGIVTTVAGDGNAGFGGDGGPATRAKLRDPTDVALDASGNLFIADAGNNRVRKVTPAGAISTVAGNGIEGFSGDGGTATEAALNLPSALAFDLAGNLFIADFENYRVRKLAPSGLIATVAGNGTAAFSGDGGAATGAALNHPAGVSVDAAGNLSISDSGNRRIRMVTPSGAIWTMVGDDTALSTADGSPARHAGLTAPGKIAVDAEGNLYIPDAEDQRVRKVSFQPEASPAPTAPVAVFGTGYVAGGPGLAPVGTLDGNFSLISCPAGACANQPYITLTGQSPFPQWLPNTGTAQWIGPDAGGDQTHIDPSGLYDYRESFDLTGFIPGSVVLNGAYATDNSGSILLNGVAVGPASSSFRSSTPFTLDSGFQAGTNTLDFLVSNTPSECCTDPTGLFVELSGTGQLAGQLSFGTMTFSPAAAELQGTSQAVTISDTLAYSGSPPTGEVAYVLNGVGYTATCTGAGSPATCMATVPAAVIAALPAASYPVTGSFAGDAEYPPATAPPGSFSIAAAAGCAVPNPGNGAMNIAYYTVAESDRDGGSLPTGISSDYVMAGLGPHGLPVYNPHSTATAGSVAAPHDLLPDGEITWWSPTLNDGGPGGDSDVVQTGTGVVSLPFANDRFYPPNGTGANDFHGFQAAILTGTFVAPEPETVSFAIASDDMAFLYLDGQIACDDGGVHAATAVPCTTSTIASGSHTLTVFYADLDPVNAVLDLSLTTSNVSIGTLNPVSFGTMTFSPSDTEPHGTNQAVTIGDTLAYSGPPPAGGVVFALNGVSYAASCTGSGSPETCTALVPAATIAALPVGSHAVSAGFAGDCNDAPATGPAGIFTIAAAATKTSLAASSTSLTFGQALTLTATVSTATGGVPAGNVGFQNGTARFNSASLNASGTASIVSTPAAGSYLWTASYAGSADDLPSTSSPPLRVTVDPAPTVTTLASSVNPAPGGSAITLTISVQSPAGTPSGSVTLSDGATVLGVLPLNQVGAATFSTSSLTAGPHSLTASYAGAGSFAGSQGGIAQVVLGPPTFSIAASEPLTLVTQHHGPIAITVTPVNGFSGMVTLRCGALPPYATCEWASAELTSTSIPVSGGPSSVQLVVDTSAVLGYESSSKAAGMERRGLFAGLLFPALLLLYRGRRGFGRIAICSLALLSALNLSGCGVKDPGSTPPGTYSITILGTSGTIQNTGTLTLVVTD